MKLILREYSRPDDYGSICGLCEGFFVFTPAKHKLEFEDEEGNKRYIGELCATCQALTFDQITDVLSMKSSTCYEEMHELEYLLAVLEGVIQGDEEAFKHADGKAYQIREQLKRLEEKSEKFAEYAQAEIMIRSAVEQASNLEFNGYVYLLGSPEGYCKIGRTKQLHSRLHSIGLQLPFRVEVLHTIEVSDPVKAERFLHLKFKECRVNGEWFLLSIEQINWIKAQTTIEGLY